MISGLLLAALLPPIFLLYKVYRADRVEREPVGLVVKLFFIGCLTVVPAALIEGVLIGGLSSLGLDPSGFAFLFLECFFGVALVEELVKYFGLKLGSWKNTAFDYCFDGIVYAVAVSIGFAAAENIGYVFSFGGYEIAAMRAVTAIPGHTIFGIFMGYYYGMAKYGEKHGFALKSAYYRKVAVIVPMLMHGFYDFCASSESAVLTLLFYVYIIALDIIAIRNIKRFEESDIEVDG